MRYEADWGKVSKCGGYLSVYCPGHPKAWATGYIHVHRIVAEEKIGRLLEKGEVVHHIDGDKTNNAPDNLEVLSSHAEHRTKHPRTRKRTEVRLKCAWCGVVFYRRKGREPEAKGYEEAFCSRTCNGKKNGFKQK